MACPEKQVSSAFQLACVEGERWQNLHSAGGSPGLCSTGGTNVRIWSSGPWFFSCGMACWTFEAEPSIGRGVAWGGWPWCVRGQDHPWRLPPPQKLKKLSEKWSWIWFLKIRNSNIVLQMWQHRLRWLFTLFPGPMWLRFYEVSCTGDFPLATVGLVKGCPETRYMQEYKATDQCRPLWLWDIFL